MKGKKFILFSAIFAVAFLFSSIGICAEYPTKDIRTICPWGAGGGTDAITRMITKIAEKSLPVSMYVENIEGGLSATGIMGIMKAKPDGYTIGSITYDSVITVPWQKLVPGYDLKKLKMICRITSEPDALMVRADSKYKTLEDILKAAKAKPGKINVGVQGVGSRVHLAMLRIQDMTGTKFNLVSYPGGAGPQKEAILSGEVEVVITSLGDFAPLIRPGKVRGIVELSEGRNPAFPDVPIMKEEGYDIQIGSFIIMVTTAGTPDDVVAKLEKVFYDAHHSDEFRTWLAKVGVSATWLGKDKVTKWAYDTKDLFFKMMEDLVKQGILKK